MSSLQYAVLHITKYKELGRIGSHIDRNNLQQTVQRTVPAMDVSKEKLLASHIDHSISYLNEELSSAKKGNLTQDVASRISSGYLSSKSIRKDAVRALGIMLTGSHEHMKEIESNSDLFDSWKKENYAFACREFGEDNIVRFTLHRDEKTPHIHCVVVPITADGKLSAKSFMNGRGAMRGYQDRYADSMEKFGLMRGIEQDLTGNTHVPIKDFKRDGIVQEKEIEQSVKNAIENPHLLNFKRVHQDMVHQVCNYAATLEEYKRKSIETELTYSNIIKDAIQSDLERIKREVNLIQHVTSMGYQLNKEKSSKVWAIMEKDSDKILIKNGVNHSGHWMYKSLVNDDDKGTIIDFMLKRGFNYKDIRSLSSVHLDKKVIKNQIELSDDLKDLSIQNKLSYDYFSSIKEYEKNNYLTARGIDQTTYAPYQGKCLKVGSKVIFGLYQGLDSQGNGTMCSTISYQFSNDDKGHIESKKYFQKGLSRGLAVLNDSNTRIKQIVITESPIDALSYKQLHNSPDGTMYLSTCGNISKALEQELRNVLQEAHRNGQEVILAFDQDKGGRSIHEKVASIAREVSCPTVEKTPEKGKDWNEQLQQGIGTQTVNFLLQLQRDMTRDLQMSNEIDEYDSVKRNKKYKSIDLDMDF